MFIVRQVFFHGPARSLTSGDGLGLGVLCASHHHAPTFPSPSFLVPREPQRSPRPVRWALPCREEAARLLCGPRVPSADGGDGMRKAAGPAAAPQPLSPPERSGDVRRAGCRRGLSPVPWVRAGNGAVAPLSPGGCRHKKRLTHFCG